MGRRDADGSGLKTALVVAGGLVLGWLTMETAFKPFLDRLRGALDRSDPARDPDDDGSGGKDGEEGSTEVSDRDVETKAAEGNDD